MHRLSSLAGLLVLAAFILVPASCGNKEDIVEVPGPEYNIKGGDWQTVPSSGGTIQVEDITLEFPAGAFDGNGKVAVTPVPKGKIQGDRACSEFYQIVLPASGTKKGFTIKLPYPTDLKRVLFYEESPKWNRHEGTIKIDGAPLGTSLNNGIATTEIPPVDPTDGEQPYFCIGLVDAILSAKPDTKANSTFNFTVDWCVPLKEMDKYELYREEILDIFRKELPAAVQQLYNLGIELPTSTIPYKITPCGDMWGFHDADPYIKTHGVVNINVDYFYTLVQEYDIATHEPSNQKLYKDLQQTLVHETFHWIHDVAYDSRYAWQISTAGSKGDEWAMFSEAFGSWSEKLTGDKLISSNAAINAESFVSHFFPSRSQGAGQIEFRQTGYGMAQFLKWLSDKTSDKKLVDLLNWQKKNSGKTLRENFDSFLSQNKLSFFNDTTYSDFIWKILTKRFDSRCTYEDYGGTLFGINKADYKYEQQVPNYSMKIGKFRYSKNDRTMFKDDPVMGVAFIGTTDNIKTSICSVDATRGFNILGSVEKGESFLLPGSNFTDDNGETFIVSERIKQDSKPDVIKTELQICQVPILKYIKIEGLVNGEYLFDGWGSSELSIKPVNGGYQVETTTVLYRNISFVVNYSNKRFGGISQLKILYRDGKTFSVGSLNLHSYEGGSARWTRNYNGTPLIIDIDV